MSDVSVPSVFRSVLGSSVLVGAAVYYVGWRRSQQIAQAFGYETGLLGLSAQEYTLRAMTVAVGLMVAVAAAILLGWWLVRLLRKHSLPAKNETERRRYLILTSAFAFVAMAAFGLFALTIRSLILRDTAPGVDEWWSAVLAAVLGVSIWLTSFANAARSSAPATGFDWAEPKKPNASAWASAACATLLIFALFSGATWAAVESGKRQVDTNLDNAREGPVASIISSEPVGVVASERVELDGKIVHTGLALMFTENDRHFLLDARDPTPNAQIVSAANVDIRLRHDVVPQCANFLDLPAGAVFPVGTTFESAGTLYSVAPLPFGLEQDEEETAPGTATVVRVRPVGEDDPYGTIGIQLQNASLRLVLDAPFRRWDVRVRRSHGDVLIRADEDLAIGSQLAEAIQELQGKETSRLHHDISASDGYAEEIENVRVNLTIGSPIPPPEPGTALPREEWEILQSSQLSGAEVGGESVIVQCSSDFGDLRSQDADSDESN